MLAPRLFTTGQKLYPRNASQFTGHLLVDHEAPIAVATVPHFLYV